VQRGLSARNTSAARRTPIIAAYPKLLIPVLTVIPGLVALVTVHGLGAKSGDLQYNNAIPLLMNDFLPNGVLGVALTGLLASFMAGMAANVSGFNTVFTYDIWQEFIKKNLPDRYYLNVGRIVTVVGVILGIGTAFIAAGYSNIMNYMQSLFSFFNAPLFATFIIGLYWKRMTAWAGFWGLLCGTIAPIVSYLLYKVGVIDFGTELNASFYNAGLAFVVDGIVTVVVTLATTPKPREELRGLVWGLPARGSGDALVGDDVWYRSPALLGSVAVILALAFYIPVF
jgi:SSS family solute:Na+ symporter